MRSALFALMLAGSCSAASALGAEKPGDSRHDAARELLVGRWRLNPALSEDVLAKLRMAGSWHRGDWAAGNMGRPGRGPGEVFGRAPARGGDPEEARLQNENEVRQFAFANATLLEVEGVRPLIVVRQRGLTRSLEPDGVRREAALGEEKARWDGSRLVVETRLPAGELRERWQVSREPLRLTIELKIERASGPTVKAKRVYDSEPASVR